MSTEGRGSTAPRLAWIGSGVRAAAFPLAAALAIGGQLLLAHKTLGPWGGIVPGVVLYLLAAAVLIVALVRQGRGADPDAGEAFARPATPGGGRTGLSPAVEWVLLGLLMLLAFQLRVHRLDIIPRGLNNDEAINALEIQDIQRGKPFRSLTDRGLNRETLFHYVGVFSYRHPGLLLNLMRAMPAVFDLQPRILNDASGIMDLVVPLRAVALLAGLLTVLALYLFARERFGVPVALLAAFFLAVSPWHLLYSRVGLRAILAPLCAVVVAGLFLRALERGRLVDHLAWGIAAGFGFWSYTSFRAIPVALAAFVLLRRFVGREGSAAWGIWSRPFWAGTAAAAVVLAALMVLSPIGPWGFLVRGQYATLVTPQARPGLNVLHAASMIHYLPARYAVIQDDAFISDGVSTTYGLIGREPETPVAAALATLGLIYAAWRGFPARRRDPASALVVLGFAALVLTVGWAGPSLTRMLTNAPWIALAAALFATRLFGALAAARGRIAAWVAGALVGGLAAWGGAQGYEQHFLQAGRSGEAMQHFLPAQTVMGMFVRSQQPGPLIYVLHTRGNETLPYLIGGRPDTYLVSDPRHVDLDTIIKMPRTTMFVIENARPFAEILRYLIMRFPQGDMTQVADARIDPDTTIFYTFTLWKDASGQPMAPPDMPMPPGEMPPGPPPGGLPPGF